jgi:AcrR family transcriptional regulator
VRHVASALPEGEGRRRRARENDERILDAAVDCLAAGGIDQLSLSKVAQSAGLTSGATYARFSDAYDLAATLWEQRLRSVTLDHCRRFTELVVATDDHAATRELASLASRPPREARLGVHLAAAALHVPDLADIIPADLTRLMSELDCGPERPDCDRLPGLVGIGLALGTGLLHPVLSRSAEEWHDFALVVQYLTTHLGPTVPVAPGGAELHDEHPESAFVATLLKATMEVIAQVGVAKASMARIGRRAGVSASRLYEVAPTRSDFISTIIDLGIGSPDNPPVWDDDRRVAFANVLTGGLRPETRSRRRFDLEVFLAASFDRTIADQLRITLDRYTQPVRAWATGLDHDGMRRLAMVTSWRGRVLSVGLQLLEELTGSVAEVNWTPFTCGLGGDGRVPPAAVMLKEAGRHDET